MVFFWVFKWEFLMKKSNLCNTFSFILLLNYNLAYADDHMQVGPAASEMLIL